MKVLIIHQYFKTPESGGALRSYYLAKALAKAGAHVSVVTTHDDRQAKISFIEGIEVHYLPVVYNNSFGFVKRVISFLKFVWSIVREAGRFHDVDICYAISTPLTTGLAAIWIKWRYRIPFIFEVGDLWPEAPVQMGVIKNSLLKFFLFGLEKKIYQLSKAVVALSVPIQSSIKQVVPHKQIHLISNMADTDFFVPETKSPVLEDKFRVKDKFVVSYIGTLGLANGLDYLLQCAAASEKDNLPIHFLICGEGAELSHLKLISKELKLSNISFLSFQNRDGVKEVLNVTDAVFVSFKLLPVLETGSPNKYFDGLAAGKLIVINFGGWMKEEIEWSRCGVAVDGLSASNFVEKIKPFINDWDLLQSYQHASSALATKKYSRKLLGQQFVALFQD